MARKPTLHAELIPDTPLNPDLTNTQNIMATIQGEFNDERDLMNQLLGQIQMADAFAKFSGTVTVSKLAYVKENKIYQSIKGMAYRDGPGFSGTWEEFCSLLGMSASKANEDIANLHTFGEEALDSMSRMGIGYRDFRQYRKLPDDQKVALIEAAKDVANGGDKGAFIDLAEDLIAKHVKEKESLATDLDISRQTLAEKKEQLDQAIEEREELKLKLRQRIARETPEAEGAQLTQEVNVMQHAVLADLTNLTTGFTALSEHTESTGIAHTGFMVGLLDDIETHLLALRAQFNLPEFKAFDHKPSWLKDGAEQVLEELQRPEWMEKGDDTPNPSIKDE